VSATCQTASASRPPPDAAWGCGAAAERVDASTEDLDRRDVALCGRGDPDAFDRLVSRHQRAVGRLMWRFTRDAGEHEELVQDVFVTAFGALASWRGSGSFGSWLRTIAVRCGYAFWRSRRRDRERLEFSAEVAELVDAEGGEVGAEQAVAAAELVHRLLGRLSERDRLVVTLLHLEGHSVAEVASLTGWSQSMVKVQAWRARGRLKKLLEEQP